MVKEKVLDVFHKCLLFSLHHSQQNFLAQIFNLKSGGVPGHKVNKNMSPLRQGSLGVSHFHICLYSVTSSSLQWPLKFSCRFVAALASPPGNKISPVTSRFFHLFRFRAGVFPVNSFLRSKETHWFLSLSSFVLF